MNEKFSKLLEKLNLDEKIKLFNDFKESLTKDIQQYTESLDAKKEQYLSKLDSINKTK